MEVLLLNRTATLIPEAAVKDMPLGRVRYSDIRIYKLDLALGDSTGTFTIASFYYLSFLTESLI